MTITGIMGCTALVLCGFAIRDSVNDLMPGQYEKLYQYDFMSVVKEDAYARIHASLAKDAAIKDYVGIRIDTVKVKAAMKGQEETVQLMVFPDDKAINGYIGLRNREGEAIPLKDGIYITQNVASVLGFDVQDHIYLQNMAFIEKEVPVKAIVQKLFRQCHLYESKDVCSTVWQISAKWFFSTFPFCLSERNSIC